MTTTPSSTPLSTPSSPSDNYTSTQWTETNMLTDLMQQKGLLLGLGALVVGFLFFFKSRSGRPEEKAARRLVRDMRHVDDPDDLRGLLGDHLPAVVRPALLIALAEIERQVQHGFDKLERDLQRL
jgi:hypothetical protein